MQQITADYRWLQWILTVVTVCIWYSWLQLTTADYNWLQWILTAVKGFLRSTYPIEQLRFSELGLKWANYKQLQQITADYRWLQWILTAVYGFLRSTYPIEQLWFCEVRLNEATWFSLEEHYNNNAANAKQTPPEYRALQAQLSCSWGWVEQFNNLHNGMNRQI